MFLVIAVVREILLPLWWPQIAKLVSPRLPLGRQHRPPLGSKCHTLPRRLRLSQVSGWSHCAPGVETSPIKGSTFLWRRESYGYLSNVLLEELRYSKSRQRQKAGCQ